MPAVDVRLRERVTHTSAVPDSRSVPLPVAGDRVDQLNRRVVDVVVCEHAVVSTLPVEPSLTVVPVLVARTWSSLTGVTVMLNVPLVLGPGPSSTLKSKLSRGRLAAVVVVGDVAGVDVGLREGVAHAQGGARQPQRAVARGRGDGVDQLGWGVVHVGGLSIPLVSTLPVEPSLTVAPVLVANTCSSLTGVTVRLNVPVAAEPSPSSTSKSKVSVVVSLPS